MSRTFTKEEVSGHSSEGDAWIIIHNKVYDVTKFAASHPGGKKILLNKAGKDASAEFDKFHTPATLAKVHIIHLVIPYVLTLLLLQYSPQLLVGEVSLSFNTSDETLGNKTLAKAATKPSSFNIPVSDEAFGEQIPFGDPCWYQDWNSPYYKDSHKKFRAAMREFVEREIMPYTHEWDEKKKLPKELYHKCYEAGWLPLVCGSGWPAKYVDPHLKLPGGISSDVCITDFLL